MNVAFLSAILAAGCPLCGGDGGVNPVKEAVFGRDFVPNLLAVAAPFALTLSLVAAARWEGRR